MSIVVGGSPAHGLPQPRDGAVDAATGWFDAAFLKRRWMAITLTTLAVLVLAVVAVRLVPPRYAARVDVLLDPRRDKAFGPDDTAGTVNLDTGSVESAQALIKGTGVLLRVVRAEKLADDPEFNGSDAGGSSPWQRIAAAFGHRPAQPSSPERYAVGTVFRALKVERVGKAMVLSITATTRTPATAARLANAVADGFVQDQRQARLEANRREATFFAERLAPLGDALRRSEDALDAFRRAHDLTATAAHAPDANRPASLNEQQLAELNTRLAAARADTAQAWARYDDARGTIASGRGMDTIPDVVRSTLIAQLRQQAAEVGRREADLAARYNDSYPALVTARAERREVERSIAREMTRIVANLKGAYDIAKSQEDGLRANMALTTSAAGLDSDVGRRLRELERVKLVDQTMFETYLARARAAEQRSNFEEHDVRVISPAGTPVVPAFPQTRLTLFCALLLGLGAGTALGLALDARETGFRRVREIEAQLDLPVVGALPWLSRPDRCVEGRMVEPARLVTLRPRSPYAEAVHTLRAALEGRPRPGACVVLVASALAGEGRSTLALALAGSAALGGRRVLVIDGDLRDPGLSRGLQLENRLGLVDMLSGVVGTAETTLPLGLGLAFMPAGRRPALATDLFGSARMAAYLDHLRRCYDLVVIDAGPSALAADAAVLSRLCDRVLFVVTRRRTPRAAVKRALALMAPGTLAGLVLNGADPEDLPRLGAKRQRAAQHHARHA